MKHKTAKPRICFIAHNAYGALAGIDTGHAGGIERQMSLMARWLAEAGYDVSMISWDEGQEDGSTVSGVRVYKTCRRDAGLKLLRFIHPRWTSLNKAMARANADIYYYNRGDIGLGQVVMWAHRHGRRCVYSVASEPDCDPNLPVLGPLRERVLYKYGLQHADVVLVQTERQADMLRQGFGIEATKMPMPSEDLSETDRRDKKRCNDPWHVLWVGRISTEKRLEWLLDVAESCSEIHFHVLGAANASSDYSNELVRRADAMSNVSMHGRVVHKDMADVYQRSAVLCCTSSYEGFPNTFLEAWSCGVPVVSTFDPDNVIANNGLGRTASTKEELAASLRELLNEPEKYQAASEAARSYYSENHSLDASMQRFARVFDEICLERRCR